MHPATLGPTARVGHRTAKPSGVLSASGICLGLAAAQNPGCKMMRKTTCYQSEAQDCNLSADMFASTEGGFNALMAADYAVLLDLTVVQAQV